ncbi:flavin reductase family protein [Trinickia mobilis]|uniref:flavin reductase family protein n=1 Tax=Trinickia mobilis TaxID=2816356 RepID=UPI001A8D9986|nr:flavin reductase family protein [Trinickia mobilis]
MSEIFEAKRAVIDCSNVLPAFKAALRGMASSVCVITTCDEAGKPHGMAASAVVSVSFDPPSMLIAVNDSASIAERLKAKRAFCINVLTSDHGPVVEAFSSSAMREHRFASQQWVRGTRGLPYLRTAQASIFCEEDGSLRYGTHTVFIGRVFEVALGNTTGPFVWHNGTRVEIQTAA